MTLSKAFKWGLLIANLTLIVLIGTAAFWLWISYQQFTQTTINIPGNHLYQIEKGTHLRALARALDEQDILPAQPGLNRRHLFIAHAYHSKQHNQIKAGEYAINPEMTTAEMLALFVSGKTHQYKANIIEGHTVKQTLKALGKISTLNHPDGDLETIAQALGFDNLRTMEGWLYPDQYHFPSNTSTIQLLRDAYKRMQELVSTAWEQRPVEGFPLKTAYELLILASIVEKETGVADERPLIARVFINRLNKGMKLQTDPTVIYGMGDAYNGNIRKRDLRKDTPYNTYTRHGLPPTPIAIPSPAAIEAVIRPAESDALFFVATGEGGRHYFSKTYKEHRKAVIQFQLGGDANRYQGDK